MTRQGLRAALVAAVAVVAATAAALAVGPRAFAHESDCHAQQTCPADDHSYVWSDGTNQWDCGLASNEVYGEDRPTVITYDGQRYECVAVPSGTTTTPTTPGPPAPPDPDWATPPPSPPPAPRPKAPAKKPKTDSQTEEPVVPAAPIPRGRTAVLPPGRYVFPIDGPVSYANDFGYASWNASIGWHHGIDIFSPLGTPIVAVADGTLLKVGWNALGGNRLWLRDRWGNYFYYAHLSGFAPSAVNGAAVVRGEVIGYVGNTGEAASTPYHLHFEIHPASLLDLGYDGVVDPYSYLRAWQRAGELIRAGRLPARSAPTPGAFLLTASDISSASGLEPETVMRSAAAPVTVQPVRRLLPPLRPSAAAEVGSGSSLADTYASILDNAASSFAVTGGSTVWDTLAQCESSGDWHANTGIYDGGLQFHPDTWLRYGGAAFAPYAYLATREQQITIARRVLAGEGWAAWPACSLKLGLR
jgi:hypothetical protein